MLFAPPPWPRITYRRSKLPMQTTRLRQIGNDWGSCLPSLSTTKSLPDHLEPICVAQGERVLVVDGDQKLQRDVEVVRAVVPQREVRPDLAGAVAGPLLVGEEHLLPGRDREVIDEVAAETLDDLIQSDPVLVAEAVDGRLREDLVGGTAREVGVERQIAATTGQHLAAARQIAAPGLEAVALDLELGQHVDEMRDLVDVRGIKPEDMAQGVLFLEVGRLKLRGNGKVLHRWVPFFGRRVLLRPRRALFRRFSRVLAAATDQ